MITESSLKKKKALGSSEAPSLVDSRPQYSGNQPERAPFQDRPHPEEQFQGMESNRKGSWELYSLSSSILTIACCDLYT